LLSAAAAADVGCTRAGIQDAVDRYIEAQSTGDPSGLNLAMGLAYIENMQVRPIADGVIQEPLDIFFHRTLIDETTCQSFTEVVVTDPAHPYVIGTRLRLNADAIVEIEMLVTDEDDWLFDAENYATWLPQENWDPIPAPNRDDYATLVAAANAYLDAFLLGETGGVPWGYPCVRTEGGMRTVSNAVEDPEMTCDPGVPNGVNIVDRRFIADVTTGSVVVFCTFGVNGLPDTHLFRVEAGKLRWVHTLTALPEGFQFRGGGPGAAGRGGAGPRGGGAGGTPGN
jgi:hypothetical protein